MRRSFLKWAIRTIGIIFGFVLSGSLISMRSSVACVVGVISFLATVAYTIPFVVLLIKNSYKELSGEDD